MGYWDWGYYKPKPRIKAKGGIKAQSKRGSFGETWWAKRWIATLESFNIGARLGRGRSYARSGQVLSIDIAKGEIRAIIGPNGAGKTSMLNVINGFYQPQAGTITLKGERLARMRPHLAASRGIAQ